MHVCSISQLEDINWRLNLQMAQANKAKMKLPNALFEFQLSSSGEVHVTMVTKTLIFTLISDIKK